MNFRVTVHREICKGCELCCHVCPSGVLAMSAHDMNLRGQHFAATVAIDKCSGCKQCAIICPDAAIEIVRLAQGVSGG